MPRHPRALLFAFDYACRGKRGSEHSPLIHPLRSLSTLDQRPAARDIDSRARPRAAAPLRSAQERSQMLMGLRAALRTHI